MQHFRQPGIVRPRGDAHRQDQEINHPGQGFAAGLDTGAFVQASVPLFTPEARFVIRFSGGIKPVHQRYVLEGGAVEERRYSYAMAVGASWQ